MVTKIVLRRLFNILLIIALIVSIYLYPDWYKRQIHKLQGMYFVAQGDMYLRKANYQRAIYEYKHGLELYPEHYGAWFNLGNIYVVYEDYYAAIDAYTKAIDYNPNYVLARMNYGIISAEKLGDFDGAIDQYNKIISIRKKKLAYTLYILNNLSSYKRNIGLAYYNKGVAYRQKSTYVEHSSQEREAFLKQSIDAYKEAVKILRNDYDARYNLALSYHLNGDYNLAGLTYCKAIDIAPMNYEAHYNLAVLLNHLKYYKEALKELHKANLIITSSNGNSNQTRYVFDIMSIVTRSVLNDESGMKYLKEEYEKENASKDNGLVYVNGKVVASEDLDKSMTNGMRECPALSIFRDEDNPDDYNDVDGTLN